MRQFANILVAHFDSGTYMEIRKYIFHHVVFILFYFIIIAHLFNDGCFIDILFHVLFSIFVCPLFFNILMFVIY